MGFHILPPGVSAAQVLILDCTRENQEWRSLRVARASGKRPVPAGVTRGGLKGGWDKWREGVMGFNLPFRESAACVQPKLKSACPSPLSSSPPPFLPSSTGLQIKEFDKACDVNLNLGICMVEGENQLQKLSSDLHLPTEARVFACTHTNSANTFLSVIISFKTSPPGWFKVPSMLTRRKECLERMGCPGFVL